MENNISSDAIPQNDGSHFIATVGAQIYNIFMKTGIAPECKPEQWKSFEKEMVKYIYGSIGVTDPDPRLCTLNAFVAAFIESLAMAGNLEKELNDIKNEKAK